MEEEKILKAAGYWEKSPWCCRMSWPLLSITSLSCCTEEIVPVSASLWTRKLWSFTVLLFSPSDVSNQSDPWSSEKDQLSNSEDNRAHPAQGGWAQTTDGEAPFLPLLQGEAALVSDHGASRPGLLWQWLKRKWMSNKTYNVIYNSLFPCKIKMLSKILRAELWIDNDKDNSNHVVWAAHMYCKSGLVL